MPHAKEQPAQVSPLLEGILFAWNFNGDYANRLVADLEDEQMVHQPAMGGTGGPGGPGMNHPAWILSHLSAYHPVILGLVGDETPTDPLDHRFGQKSRPLADKSAYLDKASLVGQFHQGHERVAAVVRDADDAALSRPMPIERWRSRFATVGHCLGYLMLYHESTHLGQLSAWRRVQGLPSVL